MKGEEGEGIVIVLFLGIVIFLVTLRKHTIYMWNLHVLSPHLVD